MVNKKHFVIGSRKSQLALVQTHLVRDMLERLYPDQEFTIEAMSTTGDNILDKALSKIGEKALFTKELEVALADRRVDFVVHSLKDLPTVLPAGMEIGAILEREDPRDALVLNERNKGHTLATLPTGSVIGTSSLRRVAQLKRRYPHLKFADVAICKNTRLAKLDDEQGPFSGIILAVAGLVRLNMEDRISHKLEPSDSLYAVSQGALAIECREGDKEAFELLAPLNHEKTRLLCLCERSLMRTLEGGCSVPIGVQTSLENNHTLVLEALVASLDGQNVVQYQQSIQLSDSTSRETLAEQLGRSVANHLLEQGADKILAELAHR
ncbi:porphobilinogen deaminase [Sporodiniella umbellata]|nr:porphobilinogen deaminase [Sporodiniella umbellata]